MADANKPTKKLRIKVDRKTGTEGRDDLYVELMFVYDKNKNMYVCQMSPECIDDILFLSLS